MAMQPQLGVFSIRDERTGLRKAPETSQTSRTRYLLIHAVMTIFVLELAWINWAWEITLDKKHDDYNTIWVWWVTFIIVDLLILHGIWRAGAYITQDKMTRISFTQSLYQINACFVCWMVWLISEDKDRVPWPVYVTMANAFALAVFLVIYLWRSKPDNPE